MLCGHGDCSWASQSDECKMQKQLLQAAALMMSRVSSWCACAGFSLFPILVSSPLHLLDTISQHHHSIIIPCPLLLPYSRPQDSNQRTSGCAPARTYLLRNLLPFKRNTPMVERRGIRLAQSKTPFGSFGIPTSPADCSGISMMSGSLMVRNIS